MECPGVFLWRLPKAVGVRRESILIIQLPMRRSMSRSRILVSRVMTRISNAPEDESFKGKCNYCHKFGHKKTNCRKLKVVQENKGNDKRESN